jgi:hypothetical protein
MYEYDGGVKGADKNTFASHGVDVDYVSRRMVTADYLDVVTSVVQEPQPPLG